MANGRLTVTICGGGLGGLTLGLALHAHGIPFRIFERASGLSEIGAGITLWSNAIAVLRHLGAADAVRAISEPSQGGVIGTASGDILIEATAGDIGDARGRLAIWGAHRVELQRALHAQLPAGSVHFAAPFLGYRETGSGVVARFGRHDDVASSLLVGADGIGSSVRSALFGAAPPRYAGYVCWRAICPVPPGWAGVTGEFWGKGDRFGVVKLPGARLYWFAVVNAAEDSELRRQGARDRRTFKPFLRERFADYQFDVPAIIEHTDAEVIDFRDIIDRPPQRGWSSGAVVLLGDAAHATTPNMGQGAGMALESALILARCLAGSRTLRVALSRYEHTRWSRTRQITEMSWAIGQLVHREHVLARTFRDIVFRKVPPGLRQRQLMQIASYDAATAPLAR